MKNKTGSWNCKGLSLNGLLAKNIEIETSDELVDTVEASVSYENDKEFEDIQISGDHLLIFKGTQKEAGGNIFSSGSGGISISSVNGNNVSIINGRVIIDGVEVKNGIKNEITLSFKIKVPVGFPLQINSIGNTVYNIKSANNSLKAILTGQSTLESNGVLLESSIDCSGQSKAKISSLKNGTELSASGQSSINVIETDSKKIRIDISGQSNITLGSGTVSTLSADISGQSTLSANISCVNANISASGMSKAYVKSVTETLSENSSGMSKILIDDKPNQSNSIGKGWR